MYNICYLLLISTFLISIVAACWGIKTFYQNYNSENKNNADIIYNLKLLERSNKIIFWIITFICIILLFALTGNDFSLKLVADYTDKALPLFYRLTAFWAGQAGSLLFWLFCIVFFGIIFQNSKNYKKILPVVKLFYWIFFLSIVSFFLFLLSIWSNPFIQNNPVPIDGNGLNPLLQHPGMIFHPPLLFLGYGGFVVPSCLALAWLLNYTLINNQLKNQELIPNWINIARPYNLCAWSFLSAGITLGGWWSYMELGWGGYWAWDPVENASLIPWLIGSATLHTSIMAQKRNKMIKTSVLLMSLTTISTFFATYLVRSGIVQSLHAFNSDSIAQPLLIFIIISVIITIIICSSTEIAITNNTASQLENINSKEGLITITVFILIALSLIILLATLFPLISNLWGNSQGLTVDFYNKVCLPLFVGLGLLLCFCPNTLWTSGFNSKSYGIVAIVVFICTGIAVWLLGFQKFLPLFTTAVTFTATTIILLSFYREKVNQHIIIQHKNLWLISKHGTHLSFIIIIFAVAFSGPYQKSIEVTLKIKEQIEFNNYIFQLTELNHKQNINYQYIEANIIVDKNNVKIGILKPELRLYKNNTNVEASTISKIETDVYAALIGIKDNQANLKLSFHPMINWLWLGSIFICLFPLLGFLRLYIINNRLKEEK